MIRYECDKCGAELGANDHRRFIVKVEIYAAAGPIEFTRADLSKDPTDQIQSVIDELNHADPNDIEDQTYRALRFDLCTDCHRAYLSGPLG